MNYNFREKQAGVTNMIETRNSLTKQSSVTYFYHNY